MTTLYVQFSDSTESEVVAYFSAQQELEVYQNLGVIDASDARWATFYNAAGGKVCGLPPPEQSRSAA
ncbi:hypothetical protein [Burkholderia ambifaria]|uniref:hypothetical protein n=1 Tax=Burkholderia ambifaria TaxID=152480 RepID=UPI0015893ED0|nr:hypothetical protein [Burkholderia ambifaria]